MARQRTPAGEPVIPISLMPLTCEEWEAVALSLRLSPRQAAIVKLILEGKRDKQIAVSLAMSISTLRTHITRIFARLDVADRLELVLHVFTHFRTGNGQASCQHKQRR
jgi:DNA-binding CsgD family transcriptional regulator